MKKSLIAIWKIFLWRKKLINHFHFFMHVRKLTWNDSLTSPCDSLCHATKVLSCLGCSSCSGSFIPIWKGVVSVNVSYCQLKKRVYFWLLKKMLTQWYSKCITMIKSLHSNHCNHSNQLLLALLKICNGRLSSKLHHWCFTELLVVAKLFALL